MHVKAVQRSNLMQSAKGQTSAQKKSRSSDRLWRVGHTRFFQGALVVDHKRCCQSADQGRSSCRLSLSGVLWVSTLRCTIILMEDSTMSMFHTGVSNRTSWLSDTADAWRLDELMLDDYMPWSENAPSSDYCMREEVRRGHVGWFVADRGGEWS